MVDALASGASGRKAVEVRVLSWAPNIKTNHTKQHSIAKRGKVPWFACLMQSLQASQVRLFGRCDLGRPVSSIDSNAAMS